MKIMYHIHKYPKDGKPFYEVGKEYKVFDDFNNFWKFYLTYTPRIQMQNGHICGPSKFAHYCYESNSIDRNGLLIISDIMKESGMMLRELIFEEIRKSEFQDLPSRMKCIWLTEKENIGFWIKWLDDGNSEMKIIEMECDGVFHIGNQFFLDSDIDGYANYQESARNYWNSVNTTTASNNETIFVGNVIVKNIFEKETFS